MSRYGHNRGGFGMNNFQQRRGGGPGGPMRGGLMGNPNFRNHPFQNQNQNRRGPNNNFNRPGNQGPQVTPQKPQQNQSLPIIPPPSPGPALTMKGPMQQQKPAQQPPQEQPKTTSPAPQPKIQSPPPKPNLSSPQPNQANKNQNQQLKSPAGNTNGQQKQPPHPSPKSGPLQGQKAGPQQGHRAGSQQGQKTGPHQGQRTGFHQGQKTGPQQGQRTGLNHKQDVDMMASNDATAESDGSQSKVCKILCKIFSPVNGVVDGCY